MRSVLLAILVAVPGTVAAQEMSAPSVTTASPGGYANPLKLDTDRYARENRKRTTLTPKRTCSADALPVAERRRMEIEYARRAKASGKASADLWVREEGMRFRQRLVAEGVCPAPAGTAAASTKARTPAGKKVVRDKNGRVCNKTRMEVRPVANLGGGGMSMGMVPVCAN